MSVQSRPTQDWSPKPAVATIARADEWAERIATVGGIRAPVRIALSQSFLEDTLLHMQSELEATFRIHERGIIVSVRLRHTGSLSSSV